MIHVSDTRDIAAVRESMRDACGSHAWTGDHGDYCLHAILECCSDELNVSTTRSVDLVELISSICYKGAATMP